MARAYQKILFIINLGYYKGNDGILQEEKEEMEFTESIVVAPVSQILSIPHSIIIDKLIRKIIRKDRKSLKVAPG
jgi:hypothetical protein